MADALQAVSFDETSAGWNYTSDTLWEWSHTTSGTVQCLIRSTCVSFLESLSLAIIQASRTSRLMGFVIFCLTFSNTPPALLKGRMRGYSDASKMLVLCQHPSGDFLVKKLTSANHLA